MKSLLKCFWIFILGSFIGCIVEEIWCLIRNKCFQIRSSLLYLPLIPVYGFAALLIVLIADKVGYNIWKIFIIGVIVAAIVEYFCSYIQEKVFKTKSWDYSDYRFNLNGRINLLYSIGFGFISMIVVKYIKMFSVFIESLTENRIFISLSLFVIIFFVLDVITSSIACLRYVKRKKGVTPNNKIDLYFDKYYPDNKIEKIYNNCVYVG